MIHAEILQRKLRYDGKSDLLAAKLIQDRTV